jgi:hypothetical protein
MRAHWRALHHPCYSFGIGSSLPKSGILMRDTVMLLLCATLLLSIHNSASARTRLIVHRTGPEVIVVPNPSGFGEPQVLVRRYQLVSGEYLAPRPWRASYRAPRRFSKDTARSISPVISK